MKGGIQGVVYGEGWKRIVAWEGIFFLQGVGSRDGEVAVPPLR